MRRSAFVATLAGLLAIATLGAPAPATASASPCQNVMLALATLTMPAGTWALGDHSYAVRWVYDDPVWGYDEIDPAVTFTVDAAVALLPDPVFLRYNGLSATPGPFTPLPDPGDTVDDAQPTVFFAGYLMFIGFDFASVAEAKAFWAESEILYAWDGGPWVAGQKSPVTSLCAGGPYSAPNDISHLTGPLHRHYRG
jgi:hypothetical protein